MEKRYYWLKLHEDFFQSKRIKKLRRIAGGDTYTIIYLKMQLKAIRSEGVLTFSGLEDTFADEIALDIDEDPDNVRVTIQYLLSCGLMESSDNTNFLLPYAVESTGSEGSTAKRVRDFRERQKSVQALQCNADVTQVKQICNGEIEIEKEIEKEIEIDKGSDDPLAALDPKVKTAFLSFQQMRKTIKKPMTAQAVDRMIKKLQKMSTDPDVQARILQQSEDHCWSDIYELKDKPDQKNGFGKGMEQRDTKASYAEIIAASEWR